MFDHIISVNGYAAKQIYEIQPLQIIVHGNHPILSHLKGQYYRIMDVREKSLVNWRNKIIKLESFPLIMDLFHLRGLGMWVPGLPNSSEKMVERLLL